MTRLKHGKDHKKSYIGVRCMYEEKNEIQLKANLYTEGNISEYVLYCALNFEPQYEDLESPRLDELIKASAKAGHTGMTKK